MNEELIKELVLSITGKMSDLKVQVTDLKRPTSKFVLSYFTRVLEEFNVDVENLQKPSPTQLPHLEHSDSFSHILPIINVFFALNKILKTIFIEDFSLTDLTDPKPSLTQVLISAMNSFHEFADWKAQAIHERVKEHMDHTEKYEQLRAQREALQEHLNQQAARKAQRHLRLCDVNDKNRNSHQRIQQLQDENYLHDQKNAVLEAKVQEIKRQEAKLQSECQKLDEETKQLESAIVKSPTHLMEQLSSLQNRKAKYEMKEVEMSQALEQKSHQKEMYHKHLELYEERDTMLTKILSLHKRLRSLESKREDKEKQTEASVIEKREIEAMTEKLRAKQTHLLELGTNMEQEMLEVSRDCQKITMQADDQANKAKAVEQEVVSMEEELIELETLANSKSQEYDAHYNNMAAEQKSAIQEMEQQGAEFLEELRTLRMKNEKELQ